MSIYFFSQPPGAPVPSTSHTINSSDITPQAPNPLHQLHGSLTSAEERRDVERSARKLNGNIAPLHPRAKAGAKRDELLASLAIEVDEPDSKNVIKTYYSVGSWPKFNVRPALPANGAYTIT